MTETGGREAATVNSIVFTIGSGTADASPTSPIRIAAGGSVPSGTININESTAASASITAISVAVRYADATGRSSSVSSTASFVQPTTPPVAAPTPPQQVFTLAGVISEAGRAGLAGVTVTVSEGQYLGKSATTDGNGYFSIAGVRGVLRLLATKTGYVTTSQSTIDVNRDTRLDFTMQSAPVAPPTPFRVGATCRDGTSSDATGSGACSSHGGVSCWKYSDGVCRPN
jgi:hypothetical protein